MYMCGGGLACRALPGDRGGRRSQSRWGSVAAWMQAWKAARGRGHRALARIRVSMAQGRQPSQPRSWVLQSPLARRILGRRQVNLRDSVPFSPCMCANSFCGSISASDSLRFSNPGLNKTLPCLDYIDVLSLVSDILSRAQANLLADSQ